MHDRVVMTVIAADIGISESCLRNGMTKADIDEGKRGSLTAEGRSELRSGASYPRSAGEATMAGETSLAGSAEVEPAGQLVAGRYRLRSLLGRGGMGRVWLAEDEVLRRSVAIKQVILSGPSPGETRWAVRACGLREARAAARVDHIGAVTVYDLVEDDGLVWVVMESLSGRTLEEALDAEGPLPVGEVTRLGLCLVDVLQATHRAGVVHGDVKPGNVYLCTSGRVVLTDFGIACTADDDTTVPGEFVGSPGYVAPERIRYDDRGPASDLFSLGGTLFAAVEGTPPFGRGSAFSTLAAVLEDEPGPFRRAGPLRPVIVGLLAKDPDRRLDADATRAALEATRSRAGDFPKPIAKPHPRLPVRGSRPRTRAMGTVARKGRETATDVIGRTSLGSI